MSDNPFKPDGGVSVISSLFDTANTFGAFSELQDSITSQIRGSMPQSLLKPADLVGSALEPHRTYEPFLDGSHMEDFLKPNWHQLIIIGNGFDLECGLPSTYKDFFEPRSHLLTEADASAKAGGTSWGTALRNAGVTVWELILQSNVEDYWYGIETAIKEWVVPHDSDNGAKIDHVKDILDGLRRDNDNSLCPETSEDSCELVSLVVQYIKDTHTQEELDSWTEREVYAYMLEELHNLEREFSAHLQKKVDESTDYKYKAISLTGNLLNDERPKDSEKYDEEESVLSLNYTRPFGNNLGREPGVNILSNVHGSLDKGNIVFGIDGSDCMGLDGVLEFTKTYRLMALGSPDMSKVVHGSGTGINGASTNRIKFYGHSLADPDYSYFQAIFDTVGLYDGDTRLVFYFRPHEKGDGTVCTEDEARESEMKKAIKLLTAYGKTMGNADHGKNLIHKLQLEGRLSVKLLPSEKYEARDVHS